MIKTGVGGYASSGAATYDSSGHTYDIKDVGGTNSTAGDVYRIEFRNATGVIGTQVVTVTVTMVPEFATIAIPVVALLRLVLFMRRKKD